MVAWLSMLRLTTLEWGVRPGAGPEVSCIGLQHIVVHRWQHEAPCQNPSQRTGVEGVIDWPPSWIGVKETEGLCLRVSQWITSVFSGATGTRILRVGDFQGRCLLLLKNTVEVRSVWDAIRSCMERPPPLLRQRDTKYEITHTHCWMPQRGSDPS